ncbi:MAG: zinc ribbon domain-containing protein [Candidatus Promineofilum sp.]|nr:zinc ribbon domain-containing protein [Promineifilum sp.]
MIVLNSLQSYLTILLGVAGGLLLALWLAVVVWAARDMRARSRSTTAVVLTVLVVLLLPVVGLVIYLLLRPRETLAQAYDRALEQEALLQQIQERPVCPTCARPTEMTWFLCPTCHTHLRQPCPVCRSPLELHWDICPYCGYLFESETTEEGHGEKEGRGETQREEEEHGGRERVAEEREEVEV